MPQTRQEQIVMCSICDTRKGHRLMKSLQGTATSSIFQTMKTNLRAQMYFCSVNCYVQAESLIQSKWVQTRSFLYTLIYSIKHQLKQTPETKRHRNVMWAMQFAGKEPENKTSSGI